jgi:hypothetical protein
LAGSANPAGKKNSEASLNEMGAPASGITAIGKS